VTGLFSYRGEWESLDKGIGCEFGLDGPALISKAIKIHGYAPGLNPPLLLITRTKSGSYAEFRPDIQES
jgi:hypothetical protein